MTRNDIISEILSYKPAEVPRLFITALQIKPGGYGEGDMLCGTSYPQLRKIAKKYADIADDECEMLLRDQLHEARFVALIIMKHKFRIEPDKVTHMYMNNTKYINNWDLVDCSAPYIIGEYARITGNNEYIYQLANSDNIWNERISVIATSALIKAENFMLTIELCKKFIQHPHHLIHKACGWMLREISKRAPNIVLDFLNGHPNIPSVMKNYALEWLKKKRYR